MSDGQDPGPPDSGMRAGEGEAWYVPCDYGQVPFDQWEAERQRAEPLRPTKLTDLQLMERAWDAARQRHTARLRRVGWLDQKGRVWLEIPPSSGFDGGSLTPLLIDVREDSP